MAKYVPFDNDARDVYLEVLERTGRKAQAAKACGSNPRVIRSTYKTDTEFADDYDDALALFAESIEEEVHRRAVKGVEVDIYDRDGNIVGQETKYSDSLILPLLRAKNPEFIEKKNADVVVTGGVMLTGATAPSIEAWLEGDVAEDLLDEPNEPELLEAPAQPVLDFDV